MRRFWRHSTPWVGSAAVHAAVLIVLGWWILSMPPQRGPVALHFGAADESTPPALLNADEPALPAIDFVEPMELLDSQDVDMARPDSLATQGRRGDGLSLDARFSAMISGRRGPAVEFFGTVAQGNRIVFILDVSGSMGDERYDTRSGSQTRFERAREELVKTITQLYPEQEFAVLLFSGECRPMFGLPREKVELCAATPAQKRSIAGWLMSVYPGGATDPRTSIQTAIDLYPDAIFLLSDGEFRVGHKRIGESVIRMVRSWNQHRIPIHTIAYQDERSRRALERIADDSGGSFRFVK